MLKVFRRAEGRGWESAAAFLLGEVQQWRLGAAPAGRQDTCSGVLCWAHAWESVRREELAG